MHPSGCFRCDTKAASPRSASSSINDSRSGFRLCASSLDGYAAHSTITVARGNPGKRQRSGGATSSRLAPEKSLIAQPPLGPIAIVLVLASSPLLGLHNVGVTSDRNSQSDHRIGNPSIVSFRHIPHPSRDFVHSLSRFEKISCDRAPTPLRGRLDQGLAAIRRVPRVYRRRRSRPRGKESIHGSCRHQQRLETGFLEALEHWPATRAIGIDPPPDAVSSLGGDC